MNINLGRNRVNILTVGTILVILAIAPSFLVGAKAQNETIFSYNLLSPPHLTLNPSTGFSLFFVGSGSFIATGTPTVESHTDCSRPPGSTCMTAFWNTGSIISGEGSWMITAPDGTVVDKGTWVATGFVDFTFWGRDSPGGGLLGGELNLLITMTSSMTGQPIAGGSNVLATIVCRAGDPPLPRTLPSLAPAQILIPGQTEPEGIFILSMGFSQRVPFTSTVFHSDSMLPF